MLKYWIIELSIFIYTRTAVGATEINNRYYIINENYRFY